MVDSPSPGCSQHTPEAPDRVSDHAPDHATRLDEELQTRLRDELGVAPSRASAHDLMRGLAALSREQLARRWVACDATDRRTHVRRVHFLCMEFLIGRSLANTLAALGCRDAAAQALQRHAAAWEDVQAEEADAALGNGGLGRLAACYLESMATLGLPAWGYGIRYEYGMFVQTIQDGQQVEHPDPWLENGSPWEFPRPDVYHRIGFGGRVEPATGAGPAAVWHPETVVHAKAYDLLIPGHATERVTTLRLWRSVAPAHIDLQAFNQGDYARAAACKNAFENISWVLYPDDHTPAGRELRLRQEYFFTSASIQDILARHLDEHGRLDNLAAQQAIHLNDSHPAIAVAELMRLLVDEHGWPWPDAWAQTRELLSYTNHTLMPEALETWPVDLLARVLPRHMAIITRIHQDWMQEAVLTWPGDTPRLDRVAVIDAQGPRVRMAHLAVLGSHQVNGVSALHGKLLRETVFSDFASHDPARFSHVTNGVSPRRWLAQCNPDLAQLIDEAIGPSWRRDLDALLGLRAWLDDSAFRTRFVAAKLANKRRLAALIARETGIAVDEASLFDVQVKRIHEYKRQLLNLLHVVWRWQAIRASPQGDWLPRTVILAGKAASGYATAHQIIRLAHDIARVVNADAVVAGRLRLVFLPNYGVSLAEVVMPAADLSQQISLAGTEASGTGNMKLALNGALTLGTADGATIEIRDCVGEENMFLFGLDAEGVAARRVHGHVPADQVARDPRLAGVLEAIGGGAFSPEEPGRYRTLVEHLEQVDTYLLTADFDAYLQAQLRTDAAYRQPAAWVRRAIATVSGMGRFSADRAVAEYARRIWRVRPSG